MNRLTMILWPLLTISLAPTTALADLKSDVDALFKDYTASTPGCTVAISRSGKPLLNKAYGLANLEHNVFNSAETRFYAASAAKQFTAAAIGLLVLDKKLKLSSSIREFVPQLPDHADAITIDHLLHHTDGLRDYFTLLYFEGRDYDDSLTDKQVLRLLTQQQAPNFAAGSDFLYSNSGYWLLAQVVESVTGQTLAQFAHARLFKPLGMTDTDYIEDFSAIIAQRAEGYVADPSGWRAPRSRFAQIGPSGVATTTADLMRWIEGLHAGYLGDVLATMVTTPGRLNNGDPVNYGFGLFLQRYRNLTLWQHGGARPGYRSNVVFVPELQLAVALLCNTSSIDAIATTNQIISYVHSDGTKPEELPSADCKALQRLVGSYALPGGIKYRIYLSGDALFAQASGQAEYQIFPSSDVEYFYKVADIRLVVDSVVDQKVQSLTLHQNGEATLAKRIDILESPDTNLGNLVGTYTSPDINLPYEITYEQKTAYIRMGNSEPLALSHVDQEQFAIPGATITFTRGKQNRVEGFVLGAQRVKGIPFRKLEREQTQ